MRVEEDREPVGFGVLIAPGKLAGDSPWLAVVEPNAEVERGGIIRDPELRTLGRRFAFVRVALSEVRRGHGSLPDLIVQAPVDGGRCRRADDLHGRNGVVFRALFARKGGRVDQSRADAQDHLKGPRHISD